VDQDWQPVVSVLIPVLNERSQVAECLAGFDSQTWPADRLEVLVADSGSTDGSRQLVDEMAGSRPWLRVVDNPGRSAAAAFNIGLREGTGEVLILFSAHGVADPTFVESSVAALAASDAAGVGGRLRHEGDDPRARAIGRAMSSRLGMGSPFRYATRPTEVDTVGHPAYRRRDLDEIGEFAEQLGRNSDYEFNWRLRQTGRSLRFDPRITSRYNARTSLPELARQFWWYGRWKFEVIRMHPASVRPRHLVAPAFALVVWGLPLAAFAPRLRRPAVGILVGYAVLVGVATIRERATGGPGAEVSSATYAAAFPTMHLAWGSGFLISVARHLGALRRRTP